MGKVIELEKVKQKKEKAKKKKKPGFSIPLFQRFRLRQKGGYYYATSRAIPREYLEFYKFSARTVGIYHILKAHSFIEDSEGGCNLAAREICQYAKVDSRTLHKEARLLEKADLLEREKIKFKTNKGYTTSKYVWTVKEPEMEAIIELRKKLEKRRKALAKNKKQGKDQIAINDQVERTISTGRYWLDKIKSQLKGGE